MAYTPFPAVPRGDDDGGGGGSLGPSTVGSAEIIDGSIVAVDLGLLDADSTLAANSDSKVATQKAVRTYVDAHTASIDEAQVALLAQVFGG